MGAEQQQGAPPAGPTTVPWGQGAEDAPGRGGIWTRMPKNVEAGEAIVVRVLTSQMRYQARRCHVQLKGGRVSYRTLAEPVDPRDAEGLYCAVDSVMFTDCERRTRYRTLVWNHTETGLEVMEYGPLIFGVITGLCNDEEWGEPDPNAPAWTLNPLPFDVRIKAAPSDSPTISHTYEVFPSGKGKYDLSPEVLQAISDEWVEKFKRLSPHHSREELAQILGMQTQQAPAPPAAPVEQQAPPPAVPPAAPASPPQPPAPPPVAPAPPPPPPGAPQMPPGIPPAPPAAGPQVNYDQPPPPPPPPPSSTGPPASGAAPQQGPQPYDPSNPPFQGPPK